MKSNTQAALKYVLADEGGYAERPEEGGGAVNMGVTFTVFKAWRATRGADVPTWADLKAMTVAEATEIYEAQFLSGVHFDDLPMGVDYTVLDAAINGGVAGSIKLLQGVLGLKPIDGHYGLVTRWAVQHRPVVALIDALCDARLAKYKTFKIFNQPYKAGVTKTWGDIWTARIDQVRKRAIAMVPEAKSAVPAGPAPAPAPTLPSLSFPPAILKMPASTDLSKGMIKRGGTPEQFIRYLHDELALMMGTWRPSIVVLHNTGKMDWPAKVFHKSTGITETLTPEQQLDNMSVNWRNNHFPSTPHIVMPPDGTVWLCWPMWKPGTHSPSWNQISWGVETVGDFDIDVPTPAFKRALPIVLGAMYAFLGRAPNELNFKMHKEDPKTQHKRCPGKNLGSKASLITTINESMISMNALS